MGQPQKRTLKIVAAGCLTLFLVWQHIQATRLGYEVERSRRQTNVLKGRIASLQMALETSLSPAQLALAARTRLGMAPASPEALRFLGRPAGVPEPTLLGRWLPKSWRSLFQT